MPFWVEDQPETHNEVSSDKATLDKVRKVTKTKTLAAYGQIIDVLFGNNNFPLTVNPTKLPDGVAESVHINIDPNAEKGQDELRQAFEDKSSEPFLFKPNGKLEPGETLQDIQNRLGALSNKLSGVSDKIIEGDGKTQTTVTFHPAMVAAKKMQFQILEVLLKVWPMPRAMTGS